MEQQLENTFIYSVLISRIKVSVMDMKKAVRSTVLHSSVLPVLTWWFFCCTTTPDLSWTSSKSGSCLSTGNPAKVRINVNLQSQGTFHAFSLWTICSFPARFLLKKPQTKPKSAWLLLWYDHKIAHKLKPTDLQRRKEEESAHKNRRICWLLDLYF